MTLNVFSTWINIWIVKRSSRFRRDNPVNLTRNLVFLIENFPLSVFVSVFGFVLTSISKYRLFLFDICCCTTEVIYPIIFVTSKKQNKGIYIVLSSNLVHYFPCYFLGRLVLLSCVISVTASISSKWLGVNLVLYPIQSDYRKQTKYLQKEDFKINVNRF